jgi:hypothetical protein
MAGPPSEHKEAEVPENHGKKGELTWFRLSHSRCFGVLAIQLDGRVVAA